MQSSVAKWLVVVLLAVIATCLLVEVSASRSSATPAAPVGPAAAGGDRLFAVAGQISPETYGVYLVDPNAGSLALYQWLPRERNLRLMAARTFIYDVQLDAYNTQVEPSEIRKLVNQQKRLGEVPEE